MRRVFRSDPRDAVIMFESNVSAILALGEGSSEPRMLCVQYHHKGVRPVWQWRAIYDLALTRFSTVMFTSDFIRREAEAIYPPLTAITTTIPAPMEVPPLPSEGDRRSARERLGLPQNARVIGNAGWLIPRKRFDTFLRVGARVAARVPAVALVIAGDGPERTRLEELASDLGLDHRVRWIGWQADLNDFYRAIDVLLFNSDWDAFPTTPLEAMSYAVPVVASLIKGGLGEVISTPQYGFLLPRHDVVALAEEVIRVLRAPEPAMSAREHIAQMLRTETCISRILERLGCISPV